MIRIILKDFRVDLRHVIRLVVFGDDATWLSFTDRHQVNFIVNIERASREGDA